MLMRADVYPTISGHKKNLEFFAKTSAKRSVVGVGVFCSAPHDKTRNAVGFFVGRPKVIKAALKKLWRYVCGDKDQGISVGSFVYRLSEMEAECKALLLVGLAPQNFDFKEFQKTFHLKINDKNMHTYDINSNDALHKEGLAIIERAFLRGNLLDVADASEKPSRPQRKM